MAVSACPKCEGRVFESATDFEDIFTQCASCGHVVEKTEHDHAREFLEDQEKQIDELTNRLSMIKDQLAHTVDKVEE